MIKLLCSLLWRVLPKRLRGSFCARSYVAYLERSLARATQFAASQPNGEELWANVRHTVEDFLSMNGRAARYWATRRSRLITFVATELRSRRTTSITGV